MARADRQRIVVVELESVGQVVVGTGALRTQDTHCQLADPRREGRWHRSALC